MMPSILPSESIFTDGIVTCASTLPIATAVPALARQLRHRRRQLAGLLPEQRDRASAHLILDHILKPRIQRLEERLRWIALALAPDALVACRAGIARLHACKVAR